MFALRRLQRPNDRVVTLAPGRAGARARAFVTGIELSGRRAFPRPTTPPPAAAGHRKVVLRLPRGHRALVANAPPNVFRATRRRDAPGYRSHRASAYAVCAFARARSPFDIRRPGAVREKQKNESNLVRLARFTIAAVNRSLAGPRLSTNF